MIKRNMEKKKGTTRKRKRNPNISVIGIKVDG